MLTEKEFRQIKTALECAHGINIAQGKGSVPYIPVQNVLVILEGYLDEEEVALQERDL